MSSNGHRVNGARGENTQLQCALDALHFRHARRARGNAQTSCAAAMPAVSTPCSHRAAASRARGDCCARGGMRIEKMGRFARRLRPHCAIYYLTCSRPRALADLWANRSLRRRRALERKHLVFRRGDGLVKLRLLPRTHARRQASRQAGTHAALRCHDHTCVAMKGLVSTIESSTGQVR